MRFPSSFYGILKVKQLRVKYKVYLENVWWEILKIDFDEEFAYLKTKAYFKGWLDVKLNKEQEVNVKY